MLENRFDTKSPCLIIRMRETEQLKNHNFSIDDAKGINSNQLLLHIF